MSVLSDRLLSVRENMKIPRTKAAKDIGISRASLEFYEKGKRIPDADIICSLANYYKVSADYLLGRTDIESVDIDIQRVKAYTGLSEKSINTLNEWSKKMPLDEYAIVSDLIESNEFYEMAGYIFSYIKAKNAVLPVQKVTALYYSAISALGEMMTEDSSQDMSEFIRSILVSYNSFFDSAMKYTEDFSVDKHYDEPLKLEQAMDSLCTYRDLNIFRASKKYDRLVNDVCEKHNDPKAFHVFFNEFIENIQNSDSMDSDFKELIIPIIREFEKKEGD